MERTGRNPRTGLCVLQPYQFDLVHHWRTCRWQAIGVRPVKRIALREQQSLYSVPVIPNGLALSSRGFPKGSPKFFAIALVLLFVSSPLMSVSAQSPQSTSSQGSAPSVPAQAGCYVEASPGAAWQPTNCGTAPSAPQMPATGSSTGSSPSDVGNGNDEVASSASTIIGSSVGSFGAISGLTSEVGGPGPAFPGSHCASGDGTPNCYSLQVNTQTFTCNTAYTGSISTTCWEQFVYSESQGQLYIQYWLLGYCTSSGGTNCNNSPPFSSSNPAPSFSCPSTNPPGGGWWQSGGSCYGNGNSVTGLAIVPATNLGTLSLSGLANSGGSGNDVIKLCISGGSCYSVTFADNVLNLYQNWKQSEFNVIGDTSGSQAVFNAGTSITVLNTLTDQSGNPIASSCVNNGSTGETNNLFLGPCTASSSGISFTEASQAFSLSATPSDVTVLAGQTATYSVGLTLVAGTAAPVTLSVVSGLPSGATPTFTPSSVTPSGSSTLTISTTSAALGDYTLTIQGQFGVLVQSTTVNLHIYDFTVGISPSDQTVLRGSSAVYGVFLTLAFGSSTTGIPAEGLTVSGLPSDATPVLSASSATPTTPCICIGPQLTVTTNGPPTGSLGDFAFTVTGTDPSTSGGSRSNSANLHIYDFSASASPLDSTVLRGATTAYTATLTLVAGSSTPPSVSLSVAGLPSGSTSGFSSASVIPTLGGATSTLTVTTYIGAPGPTALGDYSLTVTGSDLANGGSRSASPVNLRIYDFTVTTAPTSLQVLTTGSNTYTVSVTLVSGSSTVGLPTIGLTVAGLHALTTGLFSPSSGTPSYTSTLTITTAGAASNPGYTFTITGTDSRIPQGGTRIATPTLVVLTPAQALALVINTVNALESRHPLTGGQANSLVSKLTNAIASLNTHPPDKATACNQLSAFVNQVESYVANHVLTPAQANTLLGGPLGIYAIMAAIPC